MNHSKTWRNLVCVMACGAAVAAGGQTPDRPTAPGTEREPAREGAPDFGGPPGFGPGDGGPGPGRGGFGGVQEKQKLLERFDKNGDHMLDAAERKAALEFLQKERASGRGRRGPGGRGGPFGGRGGDQEPAVAGPKVSAADVKMYDKEAFYDPQVLRTFFIEFPDPNWEKEMADFKNTDVEMPAKLTVDGKTYRDIGVHFRGMSSFMMVGEGRKRSLNLSLDFIHKEQSIGGYRSMELLNSHEDPTFLRSVLSYQVERDYVPAAKANFVRVVINGESWGIYVNSQPFNKEFVKDWFGTTKGARWKVPGSPGGQGSLKYLGDDVAAYKRIYQIKSKDDAKSWKDLIKLCKVLSETAPDKLEAALNPILDVDGALKFLAVENALVNNDGYWIRTSDYNIYQDEKHRFHILPHDSNETFLRPESPRGGGRGGFRGPPGFGGPGEGNGPGGFGGRGGGNGPGPGGPGMNGSGAGSVKVVELDPLVAANDTNKVLLNKLLAVPELRKRYLGYVRDVAEKWLDWKKLGPIAEQYRALIADDVKTDTRKLYSTEGFETGLTQDIQGRGGFGGGNVIGLKNFADQRRAYLLNYQETRKPGL